LDNLEDLNSHWLRALEYIKAHKVRSAKFYNQKVQEKRFSEGELVWKVILLIGCKDNRFGKWSSDWQGPYQITRVAPGNAYFYETFEGKSILELSMKNILRSTTVMCRLICFSRLECWDGF
jgi:hypothetical protein